MILKASAIAAGLMAGAVSLDAGAVPASFFPLGPNRSSRKWLAVADLAGIAVHGAGAGAIGLHGAAAISGERLGVPAAFAVGERG
jgi:hypothetical protein